MVRGEIPRRIPYHSGSLKHPVLPSNFLGNGLRLEVIGDFHGLPPKTLSKGAYGRRNDARVTP